MKNFSILFFLCAAIFGFTQQSDSLKHTITISGNLESNLQYYTNDSERSIVAPNSPFRSNNYLNLQGAYKKFTLGVQLESYMNEALLNYNPKYKGTNLGTYFANYKSDKLDVTIGHYYAQFGSGLALRSWEDRSLGINNALRGGKITYSPTEAISLTALYGNQRSGFSVSKGNVFGIDTDFDLSHLFGINDFSLKYGGSLVARHEKANQPTYGRFNETTFIISNRVDIEAKGFYANLEHNYKTKDAIFVPPLNSVDYNFVKPGSAILLNFGYSRSSFGTSVNLRRIENMQFLSERVPEFMGIERNSLFYNDKLMNYIPALTKQHHSNLANIYVYQSQANVIMDPVANIAKFGEIGGQFDVYYDFKKGTLLGGKYGTKLAFNASSWYNLSGKYTFEDALGNYAPDYETDFFGANEKYFSEVSFDITKKLNNNFLTKLTYINQNYNNRYIQAANVFVVSNIIHSESTYKFNGNSLVFGLEHLWTNADRKNWLGANIEFNYKGNWSIFASDMYNYGFDVENKLISEGVDAFKIHFYNAGIAFKKGSTRIAANFGRQRGGLVCAGGVCRFVAPSTGFGLQLTTVF